MTFFVTHTHKRKFGRFIYFSYYSLGGVQVGELANWLRVVSGHERASENLNIILNASNLSLVHG